MQRTRTLLGAGVAIGLLAMPLTALATGTETQQTQQTPAPFDNAAPPPALLQVSGTPSRFTVSANRADVRSVLQLVFAQAHRQWVPDASVTGEVTMTLAEQPFNMVLNAVCAQTFLRYTLEPTTGIYHFTQNVEAVRNAITRIQAMNGLVRMQLQALGYSVPSGLNAPANNMAGRGSTFGFGGGFGGGGFGGSGSPMQTRAQNLSTGRQKSRAASNANAAKLDNQAVDVLAGSQEGDAPRRENKEETPGSAQTDVQSLLNQNGIVSIRVSSEQPIPVTEALQLFSQQAGVPILIDPNVPKGNVFRVSGTIARPLTEALNFLTLAAHLEWRYVGNTIFVTTPPDFQIWVGDALTPRATYPANAANSLSVGQRAVIQRHSNTAEQRAVLPQRRAAAPLQKLEPKPEQKPKPNHEKE